MLPPEPRLDLSFLVMSACALIQSVLAIIYYKKAMKYKGKLKKLNNHLKSLIKPANSRPETTTTKSQFRGDGNGS